MNPAAYLRDRPGLNLILIIAWSTMIFYGSSLTQESLPEVADDYSNWMHMAEYCVLGFLAHPYVRSPNAVLVATAACGLYGASDEFHQMFIPGRGASLADLAWDLSGSFIGAFTAKVWGRL